MFKAMLRFFEMDDSVVDVDEAGFCLVPVTNWYEELHRRFSAICPAVFCKVYAARDSPNKDDRALLLGNCGAAYTTKDPLHGALVPAADGLFATGAESPGFVARVMEASYHTVRPSCARHATRI